MDRSRCKSCGSRSLIRDDVSGILVCSECGVVAELDDFQAHIGGISGPQGTFVRVGTSGTGSVLNYRDKKIFEAHKLIDDFMLKLGLSASRSEDVRDMVRRVTEGEFGQGDWFSVLIGACAYVVMRRESQSLPIAEVAAVIGCDGHELGRMVMRVVDFLELRGEFPVYDIAVAFERAVRSFSGFSRLPRDTIDTMRKQGMFLIQCAVKWFLTTGRRPLPVVAAVLVLVAKLNQIELEISDVSTELHAAVVTSKRRYKELLEALVEVSRALPWGKEVTVKNVLKNAPLVIQYMEMKSMKERVVEKKDSGAGQVDLGDAVSECLRKDVYDFDVAYLECESHYLDAKDKRDHQGPDVDRLDRIKISHECLALVYSKFLEERGSLPCSSENAKARGERRTDFDFHASKDWWKGKSQLSKRLMLKEILEKDVGLEVMPPSFVNGCIANERRRQKIDAAKRRIDRIMHPSASGPTDDCDSQTPSSVHRKKKRKRSQAIDVDWEDFIIESLLLHRVKEEEIEKGHYNTLLDLYVFNSGIM
ncbi:hypothetical protein BT93_B2415 [Corymbia citriodora subsp. variegata]|nr:hypothetical protein BT93_B2415 [Corymbia citriodora subsp. variegata]